MKNTLHELPNTFFMGKRKGSGVFFIASSDQQPTRLLSSQKAVHGSTIYGVFVLGMLGVSDIIVVYGLCGISRWQLSYKMFPVPLLRFLRAMCCDFDIYSSQAYPTFSVCLPSPDPSQYRRIITSTAWHRNMSLMAVVVNIWRIRTRMRNRPPPKSQICWKVV